MHAATPNHAFRFGVVTAQAGSGDEWVARARRAEALGFSTLLIPDTVGATLSPMPALATAAAVTTRLRVGTYVLANDFRSPVLAAREAATVDLLSGGRMELGVGAGRPTAAEDYRRLGIPFEPGGVRVGRLAEALAVIKALLSGHHADAAGDHYSIAGAEIHPAPVQRPRPPILVAASGPRLTALAGREADIVAIGARPDAGEDAVLERVGWLRDAAGDRFPELELNINLLGAGGQANPQMTGRFGIDVAELARRGSPFVVTGTVDEMCDQLQARRERLAVSYVCAPDHLMETLAPVVERLSGR